MSSTPLFPLRRCIGFITVVTVHILTIIFAAVFTQSFTVSYIVGASIFLFLSIANIGFNFKFWKIAQNRIMFSVHDGQRISPIGLILFSLLITSLALIAVILKLILVLHNENRDSVSNCITTILDLIFVLLPILPFSKTWLTSVVQAYTSARLLHVSQVCLVWASPFYYHSFIYIHILH